MPNSNFPDRVVVHKSSIHSPGEVEGFARAMREFSIDPHLADFLSLSKSYTRLFRANRYPPLRGTLLDTGSEEFVLYTKGSVSFFEAYPGCTFRNRFSSVVTKQRKHQSF